VDLEGGFSVRAARADDLLAVVRIVHDAYSSYIDRIGRIPAPMKADYVSAIARGTTWIAEAGSRVIGVAVLKSHANYLLLDNVAVDPQAQRRGCGAALIGFAEDQARRWRLGEVRLYTNELMTENIDYYIRRGYRETHRAEEDGFKRVYFSKHVI